jgi:hypothetical protein
MLHGEKKIVPQALNLLPLPLGGPLLPSQLFAQAMVEYEEFEVSDGTNRSYALKTLLTLEPAQSAEDAFGQLVEALYGWVDARGTGFGGLEVTLLAPNELAQQTLFTYMLSLVKEETGLHDFFLEVGRVNVKVGESYDSTLSEFTIEVDTGEESRAA